MPRMRNAGTKSRDDWETPDELICILNREFGVFDLDPAATLDNRKAKCWYGPDQADPDERDGLTCSWWGNVYVNPPYGRGVVNRFVEKCYNEVFWGRVDVVVALLPASTSAAWWHQWVMQATEIRLLKGRLTYKGAPSAATWDSVIVIWRRNQLGWCRVTGWDWKKGVKG